MRIGRLEYFAAHAPAVIPDWFTPQGFENRPKAPGAPTTVFGVGDLKKISMFQGWIADPAWDIEDDYPNDERVAKYAAAWRSYWEERAHYDAHFEMERHFQWPVYWAQQVLSHLPVDRTMQTM
jgi:hypothetical protein